MANYSVINFHFKGKSPLLVRHRVWGDTRDYPPKVASDVACLSASGEHCVPRSRIVRAFDRAFKRIRVKGTREATESWACEDYVINGVASHLKMYSPNWHLAVYPEWEVKGSILAKGHFDRDGLKCAISKEGAENGLYVTCPSRNDLFDIEDIEVVETREAA